MAVVAKHGIWSNATYPWTDQTSAGYMGSIVAEIDAWITAISSNSSIIANGMAPVKKRDPSSSTNSGTRNGFAYEFPDTSIGLDADGPTYPTLIAHGTETSFVLEVGDEFEDDTQNNGFGDLGFTPGHLSASSANGSAGFDNEVIICTETTDGEEFLAVSFKLGSATANAIAFLAARDQDGHWMFDVKGLGFVYDPIMGFWSGASGPYDTDPSGLTLASSSAFRSYIISTGSITGASGRAGYNGEGKGIWIPKSGKLCGGRNTTSVFGEYLPLANGTEQILGLGYQGPAVIIPA